MRGASRFALVLLFCAGLSLRAELPFEPYATQRTIHYRGKRYSLFEIRPCPLRHGHPRTLLAWSEGGYTLYRPAANSEAGKRSHELASKLKRTVYDFALQRYTEEGFFTPATGPLLLADLQTIFDKERSLVVITDEYDGVSDSLPPLHFVVSGHYEREGKLPLEHRLYGRGLTHLLSRSQTPQWRIFADMSVPRLGPLFRRDYRVPEQYQGKTVERPWVTQGLVEVKTLVTSRTAPEDFLVLAHQTLSDSLRFTLNENPFAGAVDFNQMIQIWAHHGRREAERYVAPFVVPVTRTEHIWLESPDPARTLFYEKRIGFDKPQAGHSFFDPELPNNFLSLMGISPDGFDNRSWSAVRRRPGAELISEGHLSDVFVDGIAVRFRGIDEEAAAEYIAQFPIQEQLLGGHSPTCVDQLLHLGNGDMEVGWARYLSQFAWD